jgi:hypothetical protein
VTGVSDGTKRVILSGSEGYYRADPEPYDVQDYSPEAAWPTGLNVYEVPQEQYDRWMAAKQEHGRMRGEIRKMVRERCGY